MAGPIELDAGHIKAKTNIAYKDAQGKWRAGPDAKSKHVDAAGNVDPAYAKKATGIRQNANMVKQIMRWNESSESQARETSQIIREKMVEADSEEERRDIWKQYVDSP